MSGELISVALSSLKPAPQNVRRTNNQQAIESLAASIAAHGLLQNLIVVADPDGNGFLVVAGCRRLAAMNLLAERGTLPPETQVQCLQVTSIDQHEISLAENVQRQAMHPADEFEAFSELLRAGMGEETIAARFGVALDHVRRLLKLATVSPKLIADYRAGDMTLEQIMAFTVCDDHKKQEKLWKSAKSWERKPRDIRKALTEGLLHTREARVKFVGLDVYEVAGGAVIRDLFDDEGSGYVANVKLLGKLAREKIDRLEAEYKAAGWKWVDVVADMNSTKYWTMEKLEAKPTEATKAVIKEVKANLDALNKIEDLNDEQEKQQEQLGEQLEDLEENGGVFTTAQMAKAGVFISPEGVKLGFVKPADAKKAAKEKKTKEKASKTEQSDEPDSIAAMDISLSMRARLNDVLTQCASAALRQDHQTALAVLVAGVTSVNDVLDSRRLAAEECDLPKKLQAALTASSDEKCEALAPIISAMLDFSTVGQRGKTASVHEADVAAICAVLPAVEFTENLLDAFNEIADDYFKVAPKPLMIAAVQETFGDKGVKTLINSKKDVIIKFCCDHLPDQDWLPPELRTTHYTGPGSKGWDTAKAVANEEQEAA